MKTLKTIGKVIAALVACVLMPVLIWVALGAVIYHWAAHKEETTPAFERIQTAGIKR